MVVCLSLLRDKGDKQMIVYKCDECGAEIPIIKKVIFGTEVEVLDCGRIKSEQLPTENHLPLMADVHFCKPCAKAISAQIDYELLKFKTEILQGR